MPVPALIVDRDFGVRLVNAAFCDLTGVSREACGGRSLAGLGDGILESARLTRELGDQFVTELLARCGTARPVVADPDKTSWSVRLAPQRQRRVGV